MKLKDLAPVAYSLTGDIQSCIVYDCHENIDLETGCSIEYAVKHYGDRDLHRVSSLYEDGCSYLLLSLN